MLAASQTHPKADATAAVAFRGLELRGCTRRACEPESWVLQQSVVVLSEQIL